MIKDIIQQNDNTTPNSKQLAVLKENFPACFEVDGSFDIERFKAEISSTSHAVQEGYELKFLGKSYAKLASTESFSLTKITTACRKMLDNIYISGDNLDGLKHLLKSYNGEINCIYIDPLTIQGLISYILTISITTKRPYRKNLRILDLTGSASHSA
jgi:adenine-specific DNA-methyltransferase